MEEWCKKVDELLQTSLQIEKDLRELKTSTKTEMEDTFVKINQGLADSATKLEQIQEESDSMVARNMQFSEEVEVFESKQKDELDKTRRVIEKTRDDIENAEKSLERLCNVFAVKNDPEKVFNYPPVTFTLSRFHDQRDNNEVWYSPCFYSHSCGYKMQLQVYPNGTGNARGTHVSVHVAILPGEFDDLLCWPFRGIITLHLINQRSDTHHIAHQVWFTSLDSLHLREKPIVHVDEGEGEARREGFGIDEFVPLAELGKNAGLMAAKEYLKNDTLKFCVWNVDIFYHHH